MGWRKQSSATNGRDQNRFLFFGISAWVAAVMQTATESMKLAIATGNSRENGAESTSNGSVTNAWYSSEVRSISRPAGSGV